MKRKGLLFMVFSGLFVTTMMLTAAKGFEGEGLRKGRMQKFNKGSEHCKMLDLSDAQKESIRTIKLDLAKEVLPLANQIGEKQAKLKTLSTAERVDLKVVEKLVRELGDLKTEIAIKKVNSHQKVRGLLTEEQRVKFDSRPMKHQRHGKRGMGQKHFGQRGQRDGSGSHCARGIKR